MAHHRMQCYVGSSNLKMIFNMTDKYLCNKTNQERYMKSTFMTYG